MHTESRGKIIRRRLVSIPGVMVGAVLLLVLLPIWLPIALIVDLFTAPRRLPRSRLLLFALCWTWFESLALLRLFGIWITGGSKDLVRMTKAQKWWAGCLLGSLRVTAGLRLRVDGADAFNPGPAVLLARHACLADSLVSAWVVVGPAQLQARFVMKRELLVDPCLDIAGTSLRNYFLDRGASDSSAELAAITELTSDMGPEGCGVIFPEGTRANPKKRARAIEKIGERDPERAKRLEPLQHLLPPRPAGSAAMLAGVPDADVVLAWHTGFEGMDTFGGIMRNVPPLSGREIHFVARRVPRSEVPAATTGGASEEFTRWLDDSWLALDREVDVALREAPPA